MDSPDVESDGRPVLLLLGDSITAGFGVDRDQAYPALLEARIDEEGLPYRVIDAGVSGDTTSGGLARLRWYKDHAVDVLLVALGGNDGLRGVDPDAMAKNLRGIIGRAGELWPDAAVVLAGMRAPPSMGGDYCERFAAVYPRVAVEEGVALVPFLLEGVGGERGKNQGDGIHPNADGHAAVARTLWETLGPLLEARASAPGG